MTTASRSGGTTSVFEHGSQLMPTSGRGSGVPQPLPALGLVPWLAFDLRALFLRFWVCFDMRANLRPAAAQRDFAQPISCSADQVLMTESASMSSWASLSHP